MRLPTGILTSTLTAAIILTATLGSGEVLFQITDINAEFMDGGLQYSPDGSQIAVCYKFFIGDVGRMALLDIQTGTPLNILYSNFPDSGVHSFCWEPDGSHFLMSMKQAQSRYADLYRGSIYGGQLENITNTPNQSESWPKYSHDGNWLAYSASILGGSESSIRLKNCTTGQDTLIYSWPPFSFGDYSWCSDDTALVIERSHSPTAQKQLYYYYPIPNGTLYLSFAGSDPSFSPSGQDIVFNTYYTDQISGAILDSSDIWVFFAELEQGINNPRNITISYNEIAGLKTDPDWFPSSEFISFIFLKKHRVGGILRGDVWMLWDLDMGISDQPAAAPSQFAVGQAYPNPFNAATVVPLQLERSGQVRWELYNLLGQRILQESPGALTQGMHRIVLDGNGLASGNYWIVVYFGDDGQFRQTQARKLVLVK